MLEDIYPTKFHPMELIQFGLNPHHWVFIEENEQEAKLVNINDPDLRFKIIFNTLWAKNKIRMIEWILD